MTMPPKRILIIMSDAGGGHRAAAEAIREALCHLSPDRYQINIVDVWRNHTPWPVNRIPNSYPWLTGPGLPLWRLIWRLGQGGRNVSLMTFVGSIVTGRGMRRLFRQWRPDLVITVHPLINHIPLRHMRRMGLEVPFITVVTDMVTAPPVWFCPDVDYCIVPTEPARQLALEAGLAPECVEVVGQPVSLRFAQSLGCKPDLRQKLGLDLTRPVVLLVGGGEGYGPLFSIARAVARCGPQVQLLVVAGRNRELQARLEAVDWEIPTRVFGFVTNMPELMCAADVLISKAGPGTISEAFIAEVPLILYGHIPGQEEGNVAYVRERGAGAYVEEPLEIARLLNEWLRPGNMILAEMTSRAAALARPEASLTIARRIAGFLE
ncbi:MAG: glycosyltransferase [Anaerolineae bacterium]